MVIELLKFRDPHGYEFDRNIITEVEEILKGDSSTDVQSRFDSLRESWYAQLGPGGTSLHWAVIMEDTAMTTHILAVGKVDVNARDYEGFTALHWAVQSRNLDMVRELLKCSDMRLSEECDSGHTPLEIAHERGFKDIRKTLLEQEVVRRYVEDLYRDRQVYVDAANAILVGAALIASVTFGSWLQPPLGNGAGLVDVQHNRELRAFWVFNCLSFYFAIATVVFGARSVLPRSSYFIKRTVEKLRKNLLVTASLLACSVFFVIVAFGIAGCLVLSPIFQFQLFMVIPTILGGLVCIISLLLLFKSMLEDSSLGKMIFHWEQGAS